MVPGSIPKIIFEEDCKQVYIFTEMKTGFSKNIKIFLNYFLGPLIFIILCWSLYRQIIKQPDLPMRWQQIKDAFLMPSFWLCVILMPVNWGIEALKWQYLTRRLQNFSFYTALKSVLAGTSITMLTPNRVGEYGGRIMYVREENRIAAIPLTILGSMSQLFVTIIMGTIGLLIFRYLRHFDSVLFHFLPDLAGTILIYISILLSLLLIMIYLRVGFLIKLILQIPVLKKFVKYLHFLQEFSRKELLRILFLSFIRYVVFILQYILLLKVMQVPVPFADCFWLLTVFYLVMTMAPTIGFTELPLRAAASVEIFRIYSTNVLGMQAASLSIWIINLVIPAIIGSLLIFGLKIMKEK